jgi:hypothetical protein
MAKHHPAPRPQRTRAHVIASQSANYIERFIVHEGHTVDRSENDYGYDLFLFTGILQTLEIQVTRGRTSVQ